MKNAGSNSKSRSSAPRMPKLSALTDPAPGWATTHPDRALAFLYVWPHVCNALDELLGAEAQSH